MSKLNASQAFLTTAQYVLSKEMQKHQAEMVPNPMITYGQDFLSHMWRHYVIRRPTRTTSTSTRACEATIQVLRIHEIVI